MPSWQSKLLNIYLKRSKRAQLTPDTAIIARRQKEDKIAQKTEAGPGVEVRAVSSGTVKGEWVAPENADPHRVILYFHGGGYCFGSAAMRRSLASDLGRAAKAKVLCIDYRLAPEHPFPAALDDAVSGYRWLLSKGINPQGIVMAGDSAGGGLALAATMALRDGGAPLPAAVVGLSPWTDLTMSGWSILRAAKTDPTVSFETLAICARNYLKDTVPTNPFASPLFGDYQGMPPILIHVGSKEMLLDDAARISDKADIAGINASVEVFDGMPHVFQAHPRLPEAKGSIARLGSFIISRTSSLASEKSEDGATVTPFIRPARKTAEPTPQKAR
jgi:acetyl esterase/lipase